MVQSSSIYSRKAIEQAPEHLDRAQLFAICKLDINAPSDLTTMVAEEDYVRLLETIAQAEDGLPRAHIKLGASMRCEDLGAVGLAWKSSPTLMDGWDRAQRYISVVSGVRALELNRGKETTEIRFLRLTDEAPMGAKLSNEATFASFIAICREASGRKFKPIRAFCGHEFVGDKTFLEDFIGCELEDRAGINAIVVSNAELALPNAVGDDAISRFFDGRVEEMLAETKTELPLSIQVKSEIGKNLSGGVPKLSDVAKALGMSARTLQRKLNDEGAVFQALVDEARRELSERLLRTSQYPLVEVAFLTGFAEQSGFTRAFKRWAGQTPRSYRLNATSR
ncbi:AraC family transcriptional regulator [Alterisphingorhabdus coralli]|uniref:AraC family transcriptional regulator ligand-binding domain-containing protein n=1 Tax=Alterisphingorhabdus coralli TaxID=3071408 RepID=A0AA97F6V5_9SPHN|nr:AraC family transcriptional regulator ligand-binding domain-containing protein [Parasphingorhabdus sp. SCSIO 66989]WOE74526.1 AraC family transcriptional regulator ligand-binding domain-containing protein [Parasphingorhabdus sp. SCSIO 66989]